MLDRWIDETPPVDQPSRFGNKAFRTWYAKVDQVGRSGTKGMGWPNSLFGPASLCLFLGCFMWSTWCVGKGHRGILAAAVGGNIFVWFGILSMISPSYQCYNCCFGQLKFLLDVGKKEPMKSEIL